MTNRLQLESEVEYEEKNIILVAIILLALLFPIKNQLKDGGTIEYKALAYNVSKVKRLISVEKWNKKEK